MRQCECARAGLAPVHAWYRKNGCVSRYGDDVNGWFACSTLCGGWPCMRNGRQVQEDTAAQEATLKQHDEQLATSRKHAEVMQATMPVL